MMIDSQWLTVSDLAEQFGIPQPTIRRYIERHGHRLHTKKHHKSYLISNESIPVLVRIREAYAAGMGAAQVEDLLEASRAPTIIDVSDQSGERVSAKLDEALSVLGKSMIDGFGRQEEFNQRQEGFNRMLVEALERERAENQRQINRLTELMIQQQEAAAAVAAALPDPVQQRQERFNERFTEKRIVQQLRAEALEAWKAKPKKKRKKFREKTGLISREPEAEARDRFVQAYVDEHFEQRMRAEYGFYDRS